MASPHENFHAVDGQFLYMFMFSRKFTSIYPKYHHALVDNHNFCESGNLDVFIEEVLFFRSSLR